MNSDPGQSSDLVEERLLILAPTPRDAQLCHEILTGAGLSCVICADLQELCATLQIGAAAVLLSEEALAREGIQTLKNWLQEQPIWSDLPILLLTHAGQNSPAVLRALDLLGNVMLLERPLGKLTLMSVVRSALRERKRQYQTRAHFEMLKQAQEKADEGARAKSEFLANMSHEIRTPMTIFLGALEHLGQVDHNPEHQELLHMADQAARHLRELIDDVLDFSRIDAGQVEIHEGPLDVSAWLEDAVGIFQTLARQKNLRLTFGITDEVPAIIEADAIRLRQILNNLVNNAIKFTPQGEVTVTVKATGEHLEFEVTDTGIGIAEDKQNLLFRSFSQIDSSFQRDYGGTGLGLAISKKLAGLMGGKISVQSREGEGSIFSLILPLKVPEGQKKKAPVEKTGSTTGKLPYRILLVEDDPMIRELFVMVLTRRGALVDVAESGEEALAMWRPSHFDIILMDLQMPGMDGLEATRKIRAKEVDIDEHVVIIGVTAHARRKIVEECLKEGMNEILTKPLQIKELEEAILRYMKKR